MTAQDKLIANAKAEVGYFSKATNANLDVKNAPAGYGLYNKYARDLDAVGDWFNGRKNGYDWCDIFSDWNFYKTFGKDLALRMICQPLKSLGAGCKYSMGYYQTAGRFYKTPVKGDQIFFYNTKDHSKIAHTGLVSGVDSKYVYTIEGNCGYPAAVRECKYLLTYAHIAGYGRPRYDLVDVNDVPTTTTKPADEPKKEVTFLTDIELFCKLYKDMTDQWNDNDAAGWSKDAREWVDKNGIVTGIGNGNMAWEAIPTREQLSVMIMRYHQNVVAPKLDEMNDLLQKILAAQKS